MGVKKRIIEGPEIKISEPIGRFEIVRKVVSTFIDFEKDKKGKGIEFRYPVENLSIGDKLYIHRPGIKWNFDFKVEVFPRFGLQDGKHEQIALILRKIKRTNKEEFSKLWNMICQLYHCSNNDVDLLLRMNRISISNPKPDILLKVIKWLFIMEDIVYWHYEGRAFLYNFFLYVISERNTKQLSDILSQFKKRKAKPEKIKKLLEELGINWELP
ncbi:MAG: hypothetical protein ABIL89_01920 [candidate division WOR-3 bacterium]